MNPCSIEVEHTCGVAALSTGAVVFDFVAEVDSDAVSVFSQTQTEIDVGLTLPIPRVESANGMEGFHVNQRAAGMDRFHRYNPAAVCFPIWRTVPLLPAREELVPSRENPRRH